MHSTTRSRVLLSFRFDCSKPLHTSTIRQTPPAFAMAPKSLKISGSAAFTTMDFFLNISLPRSGHTTGGLGSLTKLGTVYKSMFHKFEVKPWKNFEKNASQILAGANAKPISNRAASRVELASDALCYNPPSGESALSAKFNETVLETVNVIQRETQDSGLWKIGCNIKTGANNRLIPDFALRPWAAGSSSRSRNLPAVVGELKLPCYSLGSHFTPQYLTSRIQHEEYLTNAEVDPVFQALSYAVHSEKGVAVLSNFDENRYFKVNIRSEEIWMSDLVKVDQRLDQRTQAPHALQAILYMKAVEVDEREFSESLVTGLRLKGEQRLKDEKRKKDEEQKKESSSSRGDGAGSSKDHVRSGRTKKRSDSLFPPVSCVLKQCKFIGLLGEGATGDVNECEYEGQRVAVKMGAEYYSTDLDCEEHVENDIDIYDILEDLQGSVIPRMIAGGLDTVYSASMVLITEKVGMEVGETERTITVGGKALDRENLMLFKEKGLEGLRKIRARGVIHDDKDVRNMRVEMRDGKVDRVCWLDFGEARVVDDDVRNRGLAESEDNGEIEAKSEASEEFEFTEEMIGTSGIEWFERAVDRIISYTDE